MLVTYLWRTALYIKTYKGITSCDSRHYSMAPHRPEDVDGQVLQKVAGNILDKQWRTA
jgi:hypothetical protein